MEKQTKTLLGLGAIAVALYFILKPKSTQEVPPSNDMVRMQDCNKRLEEKLKTMRPDDLEGYTKQFIDYCMSEESIKYDKCQDELANVNLTEQGYNDSIANCMGCNQGQVWGINSTNGQMGCITPRTDLI